jgi:hypothetical protein
MRLPPSDRDLLNCAIQALLQGRSYVRRTLRLEPSLALEHIEVKTLDGQTKEMLYVDKQAENACVVYLRDHIGREHLRVIGEETLWNLDVDLTGETKIVCLLDMIDGSDLLERNLSNWCSAMLFFDPQQPRIRLSLVQNAHDSIYFASDQGAFIYRKRTSKIEPLHGPEEVPPERASVCFYAQKLPNFAGLPHSFAERLAERLGARADRLRLYTLAGNPMMAKLANGEKIHAVFEHIGQYPHDVIPGAYIALKSKAHLVTLDGKPISEGDLAMALRHPSASKLKYVLGSSAEIAQLLSECLVGCLAASPGS